MSDRDDFILAVSDRIGCPYLWGASGPSAFDCAGLVQYGMTQIGRPFDCDICSADLYRIYHGQKVLEPAALPGSLWLYSNTREADKITHVMIMVRRWTEGKGVLVGSRGGGHTTLTVERAWEHRAFVDSVLSDYWHENLMFIVDPFLKEGA